MLVKVLCDGLHPYKLMHYLVNSKYWRYQPQGIGIQYLAAGHWPLAAG